MAFNKSLQSKYFVWKEKQKGGIDTGEWSFKHILMSTNAIIHAIHNHWKILIYLFPSHALWALAATAWALGNSYHAQ